MPLEQVPKEPLFPAELKALARDLAEGRARVGVPVFVSEPGSPAALAVENVTLMKNDGIRQIRLQLADSSPIGTEILPAK